MSRIFSFLINDLDTLQDLQVSYIEALDEVIMFLATSNGLYLVDTTNPPVLFPIGNFPTPSGTLLIFLCDTLGFSDIAVTSTSTGVFCLSTTVGFQILDIADPTKIAQVYSNAYPNGGCVQVAVTPDASTDFVITNRYTIDVYNTTILQTQAISLVSSFTLSKSYST